jgi:pimeloyl-ACP methyl ester carboxylesterase
MFLDVKEIIDFLKSRPGIDSSRIGLIGYDEGGLIATMVAGELETISFLVLMATPAIRGEAFLLARQSSIARGMGVQEETIDEQQKLLRDVHTILKKNSDPARSREKIQKLNPGFTADEISFYNSAWYRTFMVIDPEVYLKLVSCPVLALNGSLDTSCDPKTNLEAMEKAFIFSGNANYTLEELPDLNHHFQIARTGSPEEYSLVSVSFAPVVPERIAAWIRDRKVKREK